LRLPGTSGGRGKALHGVRVHITGPAGLNVTTKPSNASGKITQKLKVKKEIPRGTTPVIIEFTASEAGEFPILCSEYCGDGHEDMQGQLVVLTRDVQNTEVKPNATK